MKRLKSKEQLERKYADDIQTCGCLDYFDFINNCYFNSSCPKETFKDWFQELNTKGRKEYISYIQNWYEGPCKNELANLAVAFL